VAAEALQTWELLRWGSARADGLKRGLASATPALLHGLRLTASVCLALFVAFWLQLDNAHWAGTSAAIVAQPALGASVRKGRFRAIGTVVGGVLIVLLTAAFPQDHVGFLLGLTLWAVVCGVLTAILHNFAGYAAALAGYTAVLVFAGIIENPQGVFLVAVWRVTEIIIGISAAVIVHSLTDFGDARFRLAEAISEVGREIAGGVAQTLQAGQEDLRLRTSRRALIGRVIALDATIDEAMGEPSHLRHRRAQMQAVLESFFVALSAWRALANHLITMPVHRTEKLLSPVLPAVAALADRVWLSDPHAIHQSCSAYGRLLAQRPAADISSRVLNDGLLRIFQAFKAVAKGLLVVSTPRMQWNVHHRARVYVPDPLPGLLDGLRIVVALASVELFWVATGWPDAPTMMIFTAIGVVLFARQTDAAYSSALEFALGCGLAAALAAVLLFAILPSIHGGFFALSIALALLLLPLGALSAGSWHKAVFVSAVANLVPVLAIENETNYSAARLFNVALAIVAGTAVPVLLFQLLPPLSPERRTRRLLMLTLRDLRGLLGGRRCFSQEGWLGLLSQRLAAMPRQATLEDEAELLAALSIGQASIALLQMMPTVPARDTLDRALMCLAEANTAEARDALVRFAAAQGNRHAGTGAPAIDAAAQATIIADALQRHARFFSRER